LAPGGSFEDVSGLKPRFQTVVKDGISPKINGSKMCGYDCKIFDKKCTCNMYRNKYVHPIKSNGYIFSLDQEFLNSSLGLEGETTPKGLLLGLGTYG